MFSVMGIAPYKQGGAPWAKKETRDVEKTKGAAEGTEQDTKLQQKLPKVTRNLLVKTPI